MRDFIEVCLKEELYYYNNLLKSKPSYPQIKELCEFVFLLKEIQQNTVLKAENYVLISRFIKNIASNAYVFDKIFYFTSLYKLPQEFYDGDSSRVGYATYNANIDISIMRVQMREGMVQGSSEDDYFFERGKSGLVRAMNNLLNHCDKLDSLIPAFYSVLNYLQAMIEYLEMEPKLYIDEANDLANNCLEIVKRFVEVKDVATSLKCNFQLNLFLISVIYRCENYYKEKFDFVNKEIGDFYKLKSNTKKIWSYFSLISIDFQEFKDKFPNDFKEEFSREYKVFNHIEKTILLRNCVALLKSEGKIDLTDLNIPVCEEFKINEWFTMKSYFKGYGLHTSIKLEEEDREKVLSFNDYELRNAVAQIIINIDKSVIDREKSKPHGVYEISDMELPIRKEVWGSTNYLCMPFKSGREIKNKVTEEISYQLYRPFANFGNSAVVVFISPCEGTEPFYNAIKRATANLHWTIHTIMGDSLIKLLKYNSVI